MPGYNLPLLSYFKWSGLRAPSVDLRIRDRRDNGVETLAPHYPPGHVTMLKELTIDSAWFAVQAPRSGIVSAATPLGRLLETVLGSELKGPKIRHLHFRLNGCERFSWVQQGSFDFLLATLSPLQKTL